MPLIKSKPKLDPEKLYVRWESFGTTRHDLTVRAGTRLRGDHDAVQGWPQYFLPAETPDDVIAKHRADAYAKELAKAAVSARRTNPATDVRILEPPVLPRDEDAVVAIRRTGRTARVGRALAIDLTGQIRTVYVGHKLHRDDALVKRDPEAFVDVTNGVPRERAVVALQPVSNDDGSGNVRTIHQGQWADLDDPQVKANPHIFERVGF